LARTGANLGESRLTTANVRVGAFGKLTSLAVTGQVYAQPLCVSGAIDGKDVVYLATEANNVYAYAGQITPDAAAGSAIGDPLRSPLAWFGNPDIPPGVDAFMPEDQPVRNARGRVRVAAGGGTQRQDEWAGVHLRERMRVQIVRRRHLLVGWRSV
jgi:hypothetical protein